MKTIREMDWMLLGCLLALAIIGSIVPALQDDSQILWQHIAYWMLGLLGFAALCFVPLKSLERASYPLYASALLLLALAFLMADAQWGASRWIDLGIIHLQPAELMKWVLIVALSSWFSARSAEHILHAFIAMMLVAIPVVAILLQSDFGMFIAVASIAVVMITAAGITNRLFLILTTGCALLLTFIVYGSEYRFHRLPSLFDADFDMLATIYGHSPHAGPFAHDGLFTLGEVSLTSVQHILSAFHGNGGLIILVVLLAVYGLLISRILNIGYGSKSRFARMLSVGIAALLSYGIVANLGMQFGVYPVVSTLPTLPFIGSEGAALMMALIAMGLVMRITIEAKQSVAEAENNKVNS